MPNIAETNRSKTRTQWRIRSLVFVGLVMVVVVVIFIQRGVIVLHV